MHFPRPKLVPASFYTHQIRYDGNGKPYRASYYELGEQPPIPTILLGHIYRVRRKARNQLRKEAEAE